jgi:hypothetical protein
MRPNIVKDHDIERGKLPPQGWSFAGFVNRTTHDSSGWRTDIRTADVIQVQALDSETPIVLYRRASWTEEAGFWLGTIWQIAQDRDGCEDRFGNIWATRPDGTVTIPRGRTEATCISDKAVGGVVLTHDRNGNMWIGTRGNGLHRVVCQASGSRRTVERYSHDQGLSSDVVRSRAHHQRCGLDR